MAAEPKVNKAAPVSEEAPNGEERVQFALPVTGMDAESMKPVFVCVNGENIYIKPGVPMMIKKKFVEVLQNADDQRLTSWKFMQEQQQNGRKPLSEM